MKFIIKITLALILSQTYGFSASGLRILESIGSGIRKTGPLFFQPSTRHLPIISSDITMNSFSSVHRHSVMIPPTIAMRSSSSLRRCLPAYHHNSFLSSVPRRFISDSARDSALRIGNPCIDGVFQYGFESPTALKGFLNAVLGLEGDKAIQSVDHLKRDMPAADPTSPLGYHFTVDVRCRTKEGHHFLVEMQNDFRDDYHLKALIEYALMLSRLDIDQTAEDQTKRIERGKKYEDWFWKDIKGIYAVVITNKAFSSKRMKSSYPTEEVMEPLLVNPYELRHTKKLERHYGDIPNQIVLLMLDNLKEPILDRLLL